MTEAEAMAVLVISGVGYAHREEALKAAGNARALLQEPGAYAAQLGEAGIVAVLRAVQVALLEPQIVADRVVGDHLDALRRHRNGAG